MTPKIPPKAVKRKVLSKKTRPKKTSSALKRTVPSKGLSVKKQTAAPRSKTVPRPPKMDLPDLVTATMGFEEIVSQVSEGYAEEVKVEGAKFDIGVAHNAHAMPSQDIPYEYGKTHVTLLIVDPRFVFTYWEVRADALSEAQHKMGSAAKLTLRFYDITHTQDPGSAPSWDVEVFDRLGNWYLKLGRPEQRLCLDIGMKSPTGEFWRLARSNVMRLPPASLAAPGPIKWMVVTPGGETLISDAEEYTEADLTLLKKILGPYFFDLLMRGRFASIAGSSLEAIFYDVEALRLGQPPGESPSSPLAWARP